MTLHVLSKGTAALRCPNERASFCSTDHTVSTSRCEPA
jgi:hypothetical protein